MKVQIKKSQLTANVMFTADNWDRTLLSDAWHRGQLQWRHRDWWRSRPEASIQRMKQKKKERKTRNQEEMSRITAEYSLILSFKIPVLTEKWDSHCDEMSIHHPQLQIDTAFGHEQTAEIRCSLMNNSNNTNLTEDGSESSIDEKTMLAWWQIRAPDCDFWSVCNKSLAISAVILSSSDQLSHTFHPSCFTVTDRLNSTRK